MRGIAPSQWIHLKASVRTDLLGHVEVGGLWANVDVLDGLHFYFGILGLMLAWVLEAVSPPGGGWLAFRVFVLREIG